MENCMLLPYNNYNPMLLVSHYYSFAQLANKLIDWAVVIYHYNTVQWCKQDLSRGQDQYFYLKTNTDTINFFNTKSRA